MNQLSRLNPAAAPVPDAIAASPVPPRTVPESPPLPPTELPPDDPTWGTPDPGVEDPFPEDPDEPPFDLPEEPTESTLVQLLVELQTVSRLLRARTDNEAARLARKAERKRLRRQARQSA